MPGFDRYEVSDLGRVRSHHGTDPLGFRILRLYSIHGYFFVTLYSNGGAARRSIHRLVLEVFEGSCPDGMEVSHLDESRDNNRLSNLAYAPAVENTNMPLRRQRISDALRRRHSVESRLESMENKLSDIESMELNFSEAARVRRMVRMYDEEESE